MTAILRFYHIGFCAKLHFLVMHLNLLANFTLVLMIMLFVPKPYSLCIPNSRWPLCKPVVGSETNTGVQTTKTLVPSKVSMINPTDIYSQFIYIYIVFNIFCFYSASSFLFFCMIPVLGSSTCSL